MSIEGRQKDPGVQVFEGDRSRSARSWGQCIRSWNWLFAAAAVAYTCLTFDAAAQETPTIDEFAHLPAGCAYWEHNRLDLYSKNPPTLKYWMAIPLLADHRVKIPQPPSSASGWGPWVYGVRFMQANKRHYLSVFHYSRLMIVPLGLLTAVILLLWSRRLFGEFAAAVSSSLFLLSPTVLAHCHLATIDAGCMLGVFLTMFVARWAYRDPKWYRMLAVGFAAGIAISIKFTALLMLPVLTTLIVVQRVRSAKRGAAATALAVAQDHAAVAFAILLVVNTAYGFNGSLDRLGDFSFSSKFCATVQKALPSGCPVPLPRDFVLGFDAQKRDTEAGEFGSFLMGEWSPKGWWYYNLVAFLVKVPAPLLLVLPLALIFWFRRRIGRADSLAILLPLAVMFFVFSFWNHLNIGIRYLLPIFPFLFLLSGALFRMPVVPVRRLWMRTWPLLIVAYYGVTAILVHPGYLSYFNWPAGGSEKGPDWLIDSNMDWGQDLYQVGEYIREQGITDDVGLLYFGHVDPSLYDLPYHVVPPRRVRAIFAVSANFVKGYSYPITLPDGRMVGIGRDHLDWLSDTQPIARLGSMYVFDTRDGE